MTKEEANYVNDLITRCYKGGDKYAAMFAKDSMTIGEAQLLVLFALNEYKEELRKDMDKLYGKAKSKYMYEYPFPHHYEPKCDNNNSKSEYESNNSKYDDLDDGTWVWIDG